MDDKTFNKLVGQRLKEFRAMKRLKQKDVSDTLGMYQSQYSLIEKGGGSLSLFQAYQICSKFDINIKYLVSSGEKIIEAPQQPKINIKTIGKSNVNLEGVTIDVNIKF